MNKPRAIIIANVPWEWSTDYVNQTARVLSATHDVVCFFWYEARSVREYAAGLANGGPVRSFPGGIRGYYGIHFIPFRRFAAVRHINLQLNVWLLKAWSRLAVSGSSRPPLVWFFDPRLWPVARMFGNGYRSVYDCVDYYRGDTHLSKSERAELIRTETDAVRHASVVSVISEVLYRLVSPLRSDVLLVPQGFRYDIFRRSGRKAVSGGWPVVGYVGAVNDRLDYPLITEVAMRMPDVRFAMAGPKIDLDAPGLFEAVRKKQTALFALPNVAYLGNYPKEKIPGFLKTCMLGMIPYRRTDRFNVNSFPMKLFEYFYEGLPVVSVPVTELTRFPRYVRIAETPQQWVAAIRAFLRRPLSAGDKRRMRGLAVRERWERKVSLILRRAEG